LAKSVINKTGLFPGWVETNSVEQKQVLPKHIIAMHRMYGMAEGHTCGECKHLFNLYYARTYFKCELSRLTHGPATDWRKKWQACGKFEQKS